MLYKIHNNMICRSACILEHFCTWDLMRKDYIFLVLKPPNNNRMTSEPYWCPLIVEFYNVASNCNGKAKNALEEICRIPHSMVHGKEQQRRLTQTSCELKAWIRTGEYLYEKLHTAHTHIQYKKYIFFYFLLKSKIT